MKANELRLGNWITTILNDTPCQVNKLQTSKIKDGDLNLINGFLPFQIYPIALSEDVLIKCGFKYVDVLELWDIGKSNCIFEFKYEEEDDCNYYIRFYHNGDYVVIEANNEHGEYANLKFRNIKYFHQLQNLYYSLTGEELLIETL